MSRPDPEWQRKTALSKIATLRTQLEASARPVTDAYLAKVGAEYVGATTGQVLKWMAGQR